MRSIINSAAAALLLCGTAAHASWYQAKSKHFVIYADARPKALAEFATKLERFDQGVRAATRMSDPPVGDGNRLTVYVLRNADDVRSVIGDKSGFFDGFYTGRVAGSLAYVPRDSLDDDGKSPVFFHEYTHHLMMQDLDHPYPEWYVEGFAEFFSTPRFDRDGGVWFGVPADHRAWGLFNGPRVPVQTLFEGLQASRSNDEREVFYGRSWLLAHYLLLGKTRQGQLAQYIGALSHGASPLAAGQQAFGDLKRLDKELDAYQSKPLVQFKIAQSQIHLSPVDVTPLSEGASKTIMARAKVKYGVKGADAEALAVQLRAVATQFPGDELVQDTLAEAELEAGHNQQAQAAAVRALSANPKSTEAMVLEGRAIAEEADATEGDARDTLFQKARHIFIEANKLDTEDPEPLFEYYLTFAKDGVRPTDNAIAALHYASDLAPQDLGLRLNSAIAYVEQGKFREARSALSLVAYSPHAKEMAEVAKRMIADIDAGKGKAALLETREASAGSASPQ